MKSNTLKTKNAITIIINNFPLLIFLPSTLDTKAITSNRRAVEKFEKAMLTLKRTMIKMKNT